MKMNQYIIKLVCPSSRGRLLTDHCSGAFLNEITRAALLTVVLGVTVVLATGCASTGNGLSARLISPLPAIQEASYSAYDGSYQPERSPAFNDFFGS
jgi:hypothetical protein